MDSHPQEGARSKKDSILSHATVNDIPELTEVYISAFEPLPTRRIMYKGVPRSTLLEWHGAQFVKTVHSQSNPSPKQEERHCLKATDPDSNEIMAMIVWTYLPHGYAAEDDYQATATNIPAGANERLWTDFTAKTGDMRYQHPGRQKAHWLLELLCTHPNHERKGAASALVRWVFDRADAEGKQCFVDASMYGHKMYQRCGFEDVGEMTVDLEEYEPGCGLGVQRWRAMVREPVSGKGG